MGVAADMIKHPQATFAYGSSKGRKIYDPEIKYKIGMNKEEYQKNQDSTSINHFYEKVSINFSISNGNFN